MGWTCGIKRERPAQAFLLFRSYLLTATLWGKLVSKLQPLNPRPWCIRTTVGQQTLLGCCSHKWALLVDVLIENVESTIDPDEKSPFDQKKTRFKETDGRIKWLIECTQNVDILTKTRPSGTGHSKSHSCWSVTTIVAHSDPVHVSDIEVVTTIARFNILLFYFI